MLNSSTWRKQVLHLIKDGPDAGVYFLEPDSPKIYVDRIPIHEIKNIFRKSSHGTGKKDVDTTPPQKLFLSDLSRHFSFKGSIKDDITVSRSPAEDHYKYSEDHQLPMSRHGHYEIQIETFDDDSHIPGSTGECSGRTYHIRVDSKEKCKLAVERIGKYARKARATAEMQSQFAKVQKKVLSSCESPFFQTFFWRTNIDGS